jgi:hypothetical protein
MTCDVSLQKSAMVNTRSEANRVSRDARNEREEGNSKAEAVTDDFIYGALFQGIRKDGALMVDIARKPP